jgi:hypothetical protein
VGFSGIDGLQAFFPVVQQIAPVNVEKLYPRAPGCARKPPRISLSAVGFLPPGAAVPAPGPAASSADTRNPYTPPPSKQAKQAQEGAKSPARGPDRPAGDERGGEETRRLLQGLRADRYRYLGVARSLFVDAGRRLGLEHPHNFHRTAKCKHIAHGQVAVLLDKAHSSAFYAGLTTCGNVWTCPLCAAKIQERRREEIAKGIDAAYDAGLQPALVTLTFPHGRHQKLGQLLDQQAHALRLMRTGAPWKRFKSAIGYQGLIRSLELTHGASGWHPHTHELWFVSAKANAEGMQREISTQWESACIRAGLLTPEKVEAFRVYAVDVKGWCSTGDYLAKQDDSRHWGTDRELAKGGSKAGKATGKHPFGLLAAAAEGDRRAGRLFLSYAIAIRGRRQLLWSPGLKAKAGITERTDEQLAEEQREEADVLGLVGTGDWERVRRYQRRAQLLDAAEAGGWPAVQAELARLARHAAGAYAGPPPDLAGKAPPEGSQGAPEAPAARPPGRPSESAGGPPEGPRRAPTLRSKVLGEHFEKKKPIIASPLGSP